MDVKFSSSLSSANVPETPEVFHFWNGDEFTGQISAQKDKQKIVMEGRGIYKTSDGETYEGIWEDDSLREAIKITYKDKSIFSGTLQDMILEGQGKFLFKENVQLAGEFINNNLTGDVYLKDPEQHVWRAEAKEDDAFLLFYPLHPFWQSVLNLPSKARLFYGEYEGGGYYQWEIL